MYVQRSIRAVDPAPDDLAVVHEDAAHGRLVGGESQFSHFDGFAHEAFVVCAVGHGAEDARRGCGHFVLASFLPSLWI